MFKARLTYQGDSRVRACDAQPMIAWLPLVAKLLRLCPVFLTIASCLAQSPTLTPGSIAGEVFNIGADGQRAVVPGAHISLRGLVERQTESDAIGQYRFELLPPGRYTAEATAPGLNGSAVGGRGSGRNRGRADSTGAYGGDELQ